ncbi:SpoIIE family protein phosphatase [Gemmata sp. JC717]|uniref:SpoIIE family protein phosphatase n=1 Tax=Gemmata algarum TaxID=2975278 RepID=A0ABU5EZ30_9BACT|nr:SpoIIE family protein phosphatase [Gemmata algarum]MDY3551814.1 SpoIIE family protein phosphatase [Gemmata algarum]MDY3560209.1 SpoIIE family protein phosphatase [Gemmata algarum]
MPSLILLKAPEGTATNKNVPLNADVLSIVIGRDEKECQVVIPHHAVSRRHAQIVRSGGQFYIEDLKSRNRTFVNSKEVPPGGRQALKPDDRIKICDFLYRFHDERAVRPQPLPDWLSKIRGDDDDDDGAQTTIEGSATSDRARSFLEVAPSDRLRALLEISTNLSRTHELDPLLAQVADTLFGVFKQADRCFVLMTEEHGRAVPKVVKSRRAGMEDTRFSKTIVRKTIESMQSYLSEDAGNDASLGPAASIAEFKIRSVMCVPLATADGRPIGALQLDTQDRTKKFSLDDLNLLTIVANLAGVAIEKARMVAQVLEREKEQKEMELARKVQLGFLPQTLPDIDGWEFYAHYSPALTIGGDYYDFIPLRDGRVAIVLGDVAGKGVPAALLVAKLSSEVRFSLLTVPDLAEAVSLLNDQLSNGGLGDRFVTLAVMVLDPRDNSFTLVNAGHMSPKLYRAATDELVDAISLDATGLPIGALPGYPYEQVRVTVEPGDSIAVFTDGVTDAMNPGGSMFGPAAVDRCLLPDDALGASGQQPKRLGERLVSTVRRHANGRAQNDDIAVVTFGRLEPTAGPNTSTDRMAAAGTQKIQVGGG